MNIFDEHFILQSVFDRCTSDRFKISDDFFCLSDADQLHDTIGAREEGIIVRTQTILITFERVKFNKQDDHVEMTTFNITLINAIKEDNVRLVATTLCVNQFICTLQMCASRQCIKYLFRVIVIALLSRPIDAF